MFRNVEIEDYIYNHLMPNMPDISNEIEQLIADCYNGEYINSMFIGHAFQNGHYNSAFKLMEIYKMNGNAYITSDGYRIIEYVKELNEKGKLPDEILIKVQQTIKKSLKDDSFIPKRKRYYSDED
jgi:hypothetical protein